jgi:hypothetical protein
MAKAKITHKDKYKIVEMRNEGKTFQQIANSYSVSRQLVNSIFISHEERAKSGHRGTFNLDDVAYKGFYEYFKEKVFDTAYIFLTDIGEKPTPRNTKQMTDFLTGKRKMFLSVQQIQKMCKETGKTFEELFALRDGKTVKAKYACTSSVFDKR